MVEKRRSTVGYWLKREGELWFIGWKEKENCGFWLKEKENCGLLVDNRRRTVVYWLKREEVLCVIG